MTKGNYRFGVEYSELYSSLLEDAFIRKVIESSAFNRLRKISFLGAIDHNLKSKGIPVHNRYEHSLGVACLTLLFSRRKRLSISDTRLLVTSALLHDIGHAPLSHSMEPALKKITGIDHHNFTCSLINGEHRSGAELKSIIETELNTQDVINLVSGQSDYEHSWILSSRVNVDTLDGISRAASYIGLKINPVTTLSALLDVSDPINLLKVDTFWRTKNFVYKYFIQSEKFVLVDKLAELYCINRDDLFKPSYFNNKESRHWHETHKDLTASLSLDPSKNQIEHLSVQVEFKSYTINDSNPNSQDDLNDRYKSNKISKLLHIDVDKWITSARRKILSPVLL